VFRKLYLETLLRQRPEWLRASMASPSAGMTRTHIRLHAVALRRLSADPNPLVRELAPGVYAPTFDPRKPDQDGGGS
jgi:hypothetical protein